MKRLITSTQREIVDRETGEITVLETSKTFVTKPIKDSFYMTFIKVISPLHNLKEGNAMRLLNWMCEHAEYNTGCVLMPTSVRKEISESLNMSNNVITDNLRKLKNLNLISGENGKFLINPEIFWKGDLKEREELLKKSNIAITFKIGE